jgi:hypothetical protein
MMERMVFFMCIEVSNELTLYSQELQRYLSPQALQQLARKVGFVQRMSKFKAKDLIALCVWLSQKVASTSLTQLCSSLESSTGVLISPEGLNQRFNPSAVKLLQHVFTSLLTQKLFTSQVLPYRYAAQFQRIRILDSTTFQLPDVFASTYQGSGGSSHTAGVKIQLEYDLLSGQFLHVHDLYSLRWQIELLFKTWKSFFEIDHCKEIKKERLECHLYGQLIAILLCSSTMFQMRQLLLTKKKQELSEYKAIYIIKDYFELLFQSIQKGTQELSKVLFRLFALLQKNGRKSHRYEKKTVFDILGVVYQYTMCLIRK